MKIIVGLGNPGLLYRNTRHNLGFMFVDRVAKDMSGKWKIDKKLKLQACELNIAGEKTLLVKPLTYMNLSGEAVLAITSFYKIALDDLLIIYDELDFPLGHYRLKEKSSSGGHKGIASIIKVFNSDNIKRLRLGISSDSRKEEISRDYVLGRFSKNEKKIVDEILDMASIFVEDFIRLNFNDLMNKYNKKNGS